MAGETYTQSTGIADSYIDAVRLRNENEMKLQLMLPETIVTQKNHTWYNDDIAALAANSAAVEGADADKSAPDDLDESTNYTQIIRKDYKLSGTQAATLYKGIPNYLNYQKKKGVKIVLNGLEHALLNSTGAVGDASTARQMRGIPYWASSNTDCTQTLAATDFNNSDNQGETDINDVLEAITEKGHTPNLLICSNSIKRKISRMTSMGATRQVSTEVKKLTSTITVYESDFGDIQLMRHNNCSDSSIFIGDKNVLRIGYLRGRKMTKSNLGKEGDSERFIILTEATLECTEPTAWGKIALT